MASVKAQRKAKPISPPKEKTTSKAKPKEVVKTTSASKNRELFSKFAANFNTALDRNNYPGLHFGRQVEVHKKFKISTSAARKWVIGECLPDIPNLIMIADKLGVSLDFLFGRAPQLGSDPMVSIPIGSPQSNDTNWLAPFSQMQMEARLIETGMRMKHENLSLLMVQGDNMNPTLGDGDIVFVDTSPIGDILDLEPNGIFLIMAHGRPQIRRIFVGLDNTLKLTSDNPQHSDVVMPIEAFATNTSSEEDKGKLKVLGRISWAIHRVAKHSAAQFTGTKSGTPQLSHI